MKQILSAILVLFIVQSGFSQLSVGAAYGTFNVPADTRFKGYGPTLRVEYTGGEETQQVYLDASLYKKNRAGYGGPEIYDYQGAYIGTASAIEQNTITHLQIGFKRSLAGDFTDSKFNCFLGGGAALSFVNATYKYSFPGSTIADDQLKRTLFGFHFNAGGQWRLKPFVLELRGNFDLMLKQITTAESSNILTSLRFGIMYPIVKY